ncbi:MAG: hypothetical protein L3J31_04970 [Bacteroidales bacterium]|nr:hypothetical protein [Bacteroidales bacterium]MCF6342138.1 hypothetical protein [Bacteroidales bacterium]
MLAVVAFLTSLFDRFVYIDDAWFGEQAYWFSKLGYVKTSTIIDFTAGTNGFLFTTNSTSSLVRV